MAKNQEMQNITNEMSLSSRFTAKVLQEFGSSSGELQITDYQRSLIQGYFIGIDRALNTAEEERARKNANNKDHTYDNTVPYTWANVNLPELSRDVVHYARLGLDMMQPNHISPIPYLNKKTQLYDITLMIGYAGIQYVAENYALVKPKAVTIELVHSTDTFTPLMKSRTNPVESYEFVITNPFNRGDIVGGFGYIEYDDASRNKLVIMPMSAILKRKPQYASVHFWGGTKTAWKNGKQQEAEVDGWLEEMCRKTLIREVYSSKHIPLDPRKVDASYQYMKRQEERLQETANEMRQEINVTANRIPLEESELESPEALQAASQKPEEDLTELFEAPEEVPAEKAMPQPSDGPQF